MRKLTVIRKKAFASMFDKTWFYIEDANGNRRIDDVKCRLLCELKNGKSATCEIGEEQLKLFAVSGDFNGIDSEHGYACDDIVIEASTADVTVSGKRYKNPGMPYCITFDKK